MRGYPPVHLLILMLAFGAMAVPLAHLTFAKPGVAAPGARPKADSKLIPSLLRLRFAHKPKSISLTLGGHELLSAPSFDSLTFEMTTGLDIPADGIEFILSAEWPDGTQDTALTLEIQPDGLDTKTETRWSLGASMTEVISFQWK